MFRGNWFSWISVLKKMLSVIIWDFDGFLNKKKDTCIQNCVFFSFLVIRLKKVWKFDYLVFFKTINFREFVLAKNFAGINFREVAQNSRKLILAKIKRVVIYCCLERDNDKTFKLHMGNSSYFEISGYMVFLDTR